MLDGNLLGQTRGYCFCRLEVEPGKHRLSGDKRCTEPLEVVVAANQVIFVKQELRLKSVGASYRYLLQENTKEIQEKLHDCAMLLPQATDATSG
ncbi:MAG: DUF2846 domain-containing protein [Zoogloeaceae bacterium]|jgi:hypothetical protein|nr:DUF2846 domain-containing protein [Zoogloeaceae bacterium]